MKKSPLAVGWYACRQSAPVGLGGRREKNFQVPKASVLTRGRVLASRGAGLKMSSADRCPHRELSDLA